MIIVKSNYALIIEGGNCKILQDVEYVSPIGLPCPYVLFDNIDDLQDYINTNNLKILNNDGQRLEA